MEFQLNCAKKKRNKLIHKRLKVATKSHSPTGDTESNRTWISAQVAMLTSSAQSIPLKHWVNSIPRDDDEINNYHKEAPWEVEIPNEPTLKPIPKLFIIFMKIII